MLTRDKFLHYDSKTIVTAIPGAAALPDWINGLTVENTGNTNLFWDQNLILPGDFKAVGGNYGEIYLGTCSLRWKLPAIPPAVPQNEATITVKFYINYNK
jgi:hypothetical protein